MGGTAADVTRARDGQDGQDAAQLELGYQRTADSQAMVNVRGELDIATAEQAHAYLRDVMDRVRGRVTLNLADLTFCDAAGLGVLAKVACHAQRVGGSVQLAEPRPSLVRIMRITGMDEAFPEVRASILAMCPQQAIASPG
jgi:anti-anti-sigma factor